ncbi:MAG: hypothetical protein VX000_14905, partial [Myxococcota bacterium]|nr:hypothetical protein [Myxococcota bacterium]
MDSRPAVAYTSAPVEDAYRTAVSPTPPVAAWISTRWFGLSTMQSSNALHTVAHTTGIALACSQVHDEGLG